MTEIWQQLRSSASSSRRPGWAVPRHFTPYHHQAAQIRHHKPSFDIRDELAETAQKQAQRAKTPPREFPKAAKRVNQEDGEIEDGELSD